MVCHLKCGLEFNEDPAALESCWINEGGFCKECGCETKLHTHARFEYVMEKVETEAYKLAAHAHNDFCN
jgi:isopropylmalate/homocitrate/citramalate synthase